MSLRKPEKNRIMTVEEMYAHRRRPQPPTVLSKKRYCAVVSRARDCKNRIAHCLVEEERRYRAYLKEGNAALVKLFAGNISRTQEEKIEELRKQREEEMKKTNANTQITKAIYDQIRKERIERATHLLERLKPGPRALMTALRESEMLRGRVYQKQLNEQFAREAARQEVLDYSFCAEGNILPVPLNDEAQAKIEEAAKEKKLQYKNDSNKQREERKKRREFETDQNKIEGIVEREKVRCLKEQEEKSANELARCKRQQWLRFLREVKEAKAAALLNEKIADVIDDRKNCIFDTANRQLKKDVQEYERNKREKDIREKSARAVILCHAKHAIAEKERARIQRDCDRYEVEVEADTERRKCHLQQLYKERRQAKADDDIRLAKEAQDRDELARFDFALRMKNQEVEMLRNRHLERQAKDASKKLACSQLSQRRALRKRLMDEAIQKGTCPDTPYMCEDKYFMAQASRFVEESKTANRPLYPIIKVLNQYKHDTQLDHDMQPQKRLKKRRTWNDKCQPGYIKQAKIKHALYARKATCHKAKKTDYDAMLEDCLKIRKIRQSELEEIESKKLPVPVVCNQRYPGLRNGMQLRDDSLDFVENFNPNVDYCQDKDNNQ